MSFGTDGERVRTLLLGRRLRNPGRPSALDREVKRQLEQYFAGRRDAFDLPAVLDHSQPNHRDGRAYKPHRG